MFLYLFKYENNSPGEIRGIMRRMIRKSDKSNSWLTAFLSRENRPFPALVVRLSRPALPAPAKLLAPPASNEAVRKSMKGNKRSNTKPELLVRERLRAGRMANDAEALARTFEQAGQHVMPSRAETLETLAVLRAGGTPLLYLAGERDEKYRALAAQAAEAGATVCIIPGAGHNAHLEAPAAFVQEVSLFLGE